MPTYKLEELMGEGNLRKLAQRTVETYPTAWKVVNETLQNAKDAVRRTGGEGAIEIVFDVSAQSVRVTDNGNGFPYEPELLGFGGTDKDADPDWGLNGRQGVGLKAVILSTNHFSLDAKHEGQQWHAEIADADTYLLGKSPQFELSDHSTTSEGSGTVVFYTFKEPLVSEVLSEILDAHMPLASDYLADNTVDKICLALEIYFRSKTYAGDVNTLLGVDQRGPIDITVKILETASPKGNLPSSLVSALEQGPVVTTFPSKHWDVKGAVDRTKKGRPRPKVLTQALPEGGVLGKFNENYVYVGAVTKKEEYTALLMNPNLQRKIDPAKYDRLFQQLRGIYFVVGSRGVLTRYLGSPPRQFIAADGTPTAHVLPAPTRGGEATYVSNNIHFVANVDARLNYGKQTISNPVLVGMVAEYFADAVRATLRNLAISFVGSSQATTSADDIEDTTGTEQDVLARPPLARGQLVFKRIPRDENALIAIFFELLARGHLEGYAFYSLSQKARYDGRASIKLSNQKEIPIPKVDADLRNVEFKLDINALVDDFEQEVKLPNDLQMIVVWDDNLDANVIDYEVVNIDYTEDADRRMGGVEKILHCKRHNRMIQMVVG